MKVNNKFDIGQVVYLHHDPDQILRMITEIRVAYTGLVYCLSCGEGVSLHYEIELTNERKPEL